MRPQKKIGLRKRVFEECPILEQNTERSFSEVKGGTVKLRDLKGGGEKQKGRKTPGGVFSQ